MFIKLHKLYKNDPTRYPVLVNLDKVKEFEKNKEGLCIVYDTSHIDSEGAISVDYIHETPAELGEILIALGMYKKINPGRE